MRRTELLQELRKMRFEEAYEGWQRGRLAQAESRRAAGVCDCSFRRYLMQYEERYKRGLADNRLGQVSHPFAPVDEVIVLVALYSHRSRGFTVKHYYR